MINRSEWELIAAGLVLMVFALGLFRLGWGLLTAKPPKVEEPSMLQQFINSCKEDDAKLDALIRQAIEAYPDKLRAHEEREWSRLEPCPICAGAALSSKYAHVDPRDTHAEQIRTCPLGHTWSRRRRLEGEPPEPAPIPPRMPFTAERSPQ